jgi:hypothetical protein
MEGFDERVVAAIERRVAAARANVRRAGWSFLGAAKVLGTSFVKRARSFEMRRRLVPRVAARSMFLRAKMLAVHKAFRRAYDEALAQWRSDRRCVAFPCGTWWMRVFHGAACLETAPAPA